MRKKPFKTESKRMLDLVINSIYTNKEIFLRELISNSSDAIDKLYFKSLSEGGAGLDRSDFEIFIETDGEAGTLTIRDNGLGMTRDELENNLGTIAKSGTMEFRADNMDSLKRADHSSDGAESESENSSDDQEDAEAEQPSGDSPLIDIIGRFGVGFYSAFMVSRRVTVTSRPFSGDEAWRWQSDGTDGYTIEQAEKEDYGTEIILVMKEDRDEEDYSQYLEEYRILELVKKYSDYIRYPIRMEVSKSRKKEGGDEDKPEYESYRETDTLNSMTPLWRRGRNELSEEDYHNFYMEKFHDYEKPLAWAHIRTEGLVFYDGIIYFPAHAPFDYYSKEYEKGLQLYANGVLIMDKCADLLPDCYSFVKGLVDSPDLSLNISRETLQQDRQLQAIARNLNRRIKTELLRMQKDEREKYEGFFKGFGLQLKFGVYNSFGADKENLQDLLLYHSLQEDKMVTLAEYTEKMPEGQDAIYYACGGSIARVRSLPQTELILDKGYDILALTDDVDEFAIKIIGEYNEKPIKSVSDRDLDFSDEEEQESAKEQAQENKSLLEAIKSALGERVTDVRLSKRLKSHPVCLTADGPLTLEMEKVLNSMPAADRQVKAERVLEINGSHPVFETLRLLGKESEKLPVYAGLLYNSALLIEGLPIEDPAAFADDICSLME
ncbi:MAG: molecular chaperone HtpG [Oscillospiraceae bacterium]|nr:molecular chaperone HtpG [Oscillospiraceae bacterium]